ERLRRSPHAGRMPTMVPGWASLESSWSGLRGTSPVRHSPSHVIPRRGAATGEHVSNRTRSLPAPLLRTSSVAIMPETARPGCPGRDHTGSYGPAATTAVIDRFFNDSVLPVVTRTLRG